MVTLPMRSSLTSRRSSSVSSRWICSPIRVLVRAGQTEASVDLARMAGLKPSGVICEIMRDDGEMARIPDLIPFCSEHGLKILTVAELIRYRLRHERYIVRAGETRIQTVRRVPHDRLRERSQRR